MNCHQIILETLGIILALLSATWLAVEMSGKRSCSVPHQTIRACSEVGAGNQIAHLLSGLRMNI